MNTLLIAVARWRVAVKFNSVKKFLFIASLLLATLATSLTGCKSAYYAAYEKFGVYKRDLLKKRVVAARDEQKEAGEQFKDALTRLKDLYKFDGGRLETAYKELQGEYDDCATRADNVRKRIREMESVATDLFLEWEKEIGEISSPNLQSSSRKQLSETKQRYESMHAALLSAEQSMSPVLNQLKDYVLFLKHNLNAQAIASLKGEAANVQVEISKLLSQMNSAIARADEFVKTIQ